MLTNAFSVTSMNVCPRLPNELEPKFGNGQAQLRRPLRAIDVLTISGNPTLGVYLSSLFHQSVWTVACTHSCAAGTAFLRDNRAAVAVCEETLPDDSWRDVAAALGVVPDEPALIVVGGDEALVWDVQTFGGFDALVRLLREADVVWTIASAWHAWMKRFEAGGSGEP